MIIQSLQELIAVCRKHYRNRVIQYPSFGVMHRRLRAFNVIA